MMAVRSEANRLHIRGDLIECKWACDENSTF